MTAERLKHLEFETDVVWVKKLRSERPAKISPNHIIGLFSEMPKGFPTEIHLKDNPAA